MRWMIFLLFLHIPLFGSYETTISGANSLLLEGKRESAIERLSLWLSRDENKNKKEPLLKVYKSLEKMSSMFLTNEGLKKYQLARSICEKNINQCVGALEESEKLEPGHVKIITGKIRTLIKLNQCKDAIEISKKYLKKNPYHQSIIESYLVSLACVGDWEEFKSYRSKLNKKEVMRYDLEYVFEFKGKDLEKSYSLKKLLKSDYFLLIKSKQLISQKQDPRVWLEKYKVLCTKEDKKLHFLDNFDPRVCQDIAFVSEQLSQYKEEDIKK